MPSKLPWTAVRDEYGNTGIVDADGEYIVEELATEQEVSAENAEMIVNAVNAAFMSSTVNPKYVHQFLTSNGEWDTVTEDDDVTPVTWTDKAEADREMDEFFGAIEQAVARGDMSEHDRADWRVSELEVK